ncbi:hypothetical protein AB1Y20_003393 [Prymnesium parvum]|uniref:JmjC domain-containing protein n=1 Tax=Prymnesium parvum TaxID=97485 RepID=A0AB34JE28_PRYPA
MKVGARAAALLARIAQHPLTAPREDEPQQDGICLMWTVDGVLPAEFRGESDLLWQQRCYDDERQYHNALCAAYRLVAARDTSLFLQRMGPDDGLFGALCATTDEGLVISRDLLDSVNEMCFLEEQLQLSDWPAGTAVLDIGGGYGRWAHRASQALPHLRVLSTDGVAHSLACAEAYLRHRSVSSTQARVVPPDELEAALRESPPRLAIAIHSLPEMRPCDAERWLRLIHAHGTPFVFVVSNVPALHGEAAHVELMNDDGTPMGELIKASGYVLRCAQPKYHRLRAGTPRSSVPPAYGECTYLLFERRPTSLLPPPPTPEARLRASPSASSKGAVLILNLRRREDRRAWMSASAVAPLRELSLDVRFLDAFDARDRSEVAAPPSGMEPWAGWALDSQGLEALRARWSELGLLPVQAEELALYHGRAVSPAELACVASHRAAWETARDEQLDWVLVLEDDVIPFNTSARRTAREYSRQWARVWHVVSQQLRWLHAAEQRWDLMYIGRNRLGTDQAAVGEKLVVPGFSTCAHAYLLSASGVNRLCSIPMREAGFPADDILPALYSAHPRHDVEAWASAMCARQGPLRALALRDDMVWQLESIAAGGLDELLDAPSLASLASSALSRSDIRPMRLSRPYRTHRHAASVASPSAHPAIFPFGWPAPDCVAPSPPLSARRHEDEATSAPLTPRGAAAGRLVPWDLLPVWAWLYVAAKGGDELVRCLRPVARGMRAMMDSMQLWRCFLLSWMQAVAQDEAFHTPPGQAIRHANAAAMFVRSWRDSCYGYFAEQQATLGCHANQPHVLAAARSSALLPGNAATRTSPGAAGRISRDCVAFAEALRQRPDARFLELLGAATLSPRQLQRRLRGSPFVLSFQMADLVCTPSLWTLCGLLDTFGPRDFPCVDQSAVNGPARCQMRLLDFLAYVEAQDAFPECADQEMLYLFEDAPPEELVADLKPLTHFGNDLLEEAVVATAASTATCGEGITRQHDTTSDLLNERQWLVVGGAGSGCRWHVDPFETSAWNMLLQGRKLWCLMAPESQSAPQHPSRAGDGASGERPHMAGAPPGVSWHGWSERLGGHVIAPPAFDWFKAQLGSGCDAARHDSLLWWLQTPGEVMWVPRGWWHCTLNLEPTVAFTRNVVPRASVRDVINALDAVPGQEGAVRALRAVMNECCET